MGPSTLPCGIPLLTSVQPDLSSPIMTLCFRPVRKHLSHSRRLPVIPKDLIFSMSLWCGTASKAFLKSRYIISTGIPRSSMLDQSSIQQSNCVIQDLPGTKPCWLSQNKSFDIMCSTMLSRITDSMTLQITDVRLIGLIGIRSDFVRQSVIQ